MTSPANLAVELVSHQTYRRRELHDQYGGQRQGGISTPRRFPVIFLFSSPSGHLYGYEDGWTAGGLYLYTGEGQSGPMEFSRGNAAIRFHQERDEQLHVFEQVESGVFEYLGEMRYVSNQLIMRPDAQGNPRQAIVFTLAPV